MKTKTTVSCVRDKTGMRHLRALLLRSLTFCALAACAAGCATSKFSAPGKLDGLTIKGTDGRCDHIVHVNTQLPYALMVAAVSFVSYIAAAFVGSVWISLPIAIVLMLVTLVSLRIIMKG